MQNFRLMTVSIAATMALLSCAEPTADRTAKTTTVRESPDTLSMPEGYVSTPGGLYHRSCVIAIPDGAVLRYDGTVTLKTGARYSVPTTCSYPILRPSSPVRATQDGGVQRLATPFSLSDMPTLNGYAEEAFFSSTYPLMQVAADWNVPTGPVAYAQQAYFNFPGLVSPAYILQPVVQFGVSGAGGGPYWSMTGWKCGAIHQPCFVLGSLKKVNSGDQIHGSVVGTGCVGSICNWTVAATDQTTGTAFSQLAVDSQYYFQGEGGDVEAKGATSCDEIPINGVTYTGISFVDRNGTHLNPSFQRVYPDSASLSCGYLITTTATTVHDIHNVSSVTATANGGLSGAVGCIAPACTGGAGFITSVTAAGSVLTVKNSHGATGQITLSGATATGGFTASCSGLCTGPQPIVNVTVSGTVISLQDGHGHSGSITLSGPSITSLTRGQSIFCVGLACGGTTSITDFSAYGEPGISLISDSHGNTYFIKFQ